MVYGSWFALIGIHFALRNLNLLDENRHFNFLVDSTRYIHTLLKYVPEYIELNVICIQ
jgi:hypothetical protein